MGETSGTEPTPRQYGDQSCRRTNCKRRRARERQARPTSALQYFGQRGRVTQGPAELPRYPQDRAIVSGARTGGGRWTSPTNSDGTSGEPKHSADIPKCRAGQNQRSPSASEYKIEFLLVGLVTAKKTRNQNVSTSFTNFEISGWRKE